MPNEERLLELVDEIEGLGEPLGRDFSTGCWGARAFVMAGRSGEHPCEYFGISEEQLQAKITINSETPPEVRNSVMVQQTLEMLGSRG